MHRKPTAWPISQNGLEERFQGLVLLQITQGIGLVTQAQRRITRVLLDQLVARGQYFGRFATVEGLQNRLEQGLALHQLFQPLGQPGAVERLGQVTIRLPLKRTHDHRLTVFGSDHDEYAFVTQQPLDHQVFQHLLTVLAAITQVEIVQHEVITLLRAHAQSLLTGIGGVHFLDAQLTQHRSH